MAYTPPPGLRPPNGLPSNPLISLAAPPEPHKGVIRYGFTLQGTQNVIDDPVAWRRALINDKALFLKALVRLAAAKGFTLDPELHFSTIEKGFIGSSDVICVRPTKHLRNQEVFSSRGLHKFVGKSESTTPFHGEFGFVSPTYWKSKVGRPSTGVSAPVYSIDESAVDIVQENETGKILLPKIAESQWKLMAMSEHDYYHDMTMKDNLGIGVLDDGDLGLHGTPYEKLSLSVHAAACAELFKNKKRKDTYLKWVADHFDLLAELQDALGSDTKKKRDVITYFAEIAFHRIARVLSPDDPDLIASQASHNMDKLKLSMPPTTSPFLQVASGLRYFYHDTLGNGSSHLKPMTGAESRYHDLTGREKLWTLAAWRPSSSQISKKRKYKPLHDPARKTSVEIDGKKYKIDPIDSIILRQLKLERKPFKSFLP